VAKARRSRGRSSRQRTLKYGPNWARARYTTFTVVFPVRNAVIKMFPRRALPILEASFLASASERRIPADFSLRGYIFILSQRPRCLMIVGIFLSRLDLIRRARTTPGDGRGVRRNFIPGNAHLSQGWRPWWE